MRNGSTNVPIRLISVPAKTSQKARGRPPTCVVTARRTRAARGGPASVGGTVRTALALRTDAPRDSDSAGTESVRRGRVQLPLLLLGLGREVADVLAHPLVRQAHRQRQRVDRP